jgi:hypothetical protein
MNARIEMTGDVYGKWEVLSHNGGRGWLCRCRCGVEKVVDGGSLRSGRSSGCTMCHAGSGLRTTHGQKRTRLYTIWSRIIGRCENPNDEAYPRYGGRGISISPPWRQNFESFRDWALANGYEKTLTIDRRDNDGNYEPGNCRWATYAEQSRNTSRNRPIEYLGRTVLVCDLAIEVGLPQDVLKNRIFRYGWTVEEAVSTPTMKKGQRRKPFSVQHGNIDQIAKVAA